MGEVISLHPESRITGAVLLEAIAEAKEAAARYQVGAGHAGTEFVANTYLFYAGNLEQRIRHLALMADL